MYLSTGIDSTTHNGQTKHSVAISKFDYPAPLSSVCFPYEPQHVIAKGVCICIPAD